MKKVIFVGIISIILIASFVVGLYFYQSGDVVEKLSKSVVLLEVYDDENEMIATGSGYFIYDDRTIVTNYHVIEDAYSITALSENNDKIKISTMLDYNEEKDIAILKCDEHTEIPHIPFADVTQLKKGEAVIAIGSPLGIQNTVSTGVISSFDDKSDVMKIHTTAPISSGSSGGLLATEDGKAVGITSASYIDGQNLNVAIDIREVIDLYEDDLKKSVSLSDFFESKEHFYKYEEIRTGKLLKDYRHYQYRKMCVVGWVSTSLYDENGATNVLFLVDSPDEVLSSGVTNLIPFYEYDRLNEFKAIIVGNNGDETMIEAGTQVKIYGEVRYDVQFERIAVTPYKIETLN